MAHILPDPPRDWRDFRMASPPPRCPHGVPYAQRCTSCGWVCPTCKRAYAPWVRECSYSHEDGRQVRTGAQPGTFRPITPVPADEPAAASLHLPAEMASPHYQRIVRVERSWGEVMPGLQCYVRNPVPEEDGSVTICLRLTPQEDPT